ncbi:RND family transporter [Smaragdicoccus niigatensis]|uniref:MMPL/RND family transporter n=1 Tax=Smaragdicoccus niigatensis TaxID=359359 RepID=UPI0003A980EE|nr:RND family transporter [Smaragdicoccus niigatensis]
MNSTDTVTPLGRWCARVSGVLTRWPKAAILTWLAIAAITNVAWPQLGSVIERQAPPSLPPDAHSVQLFSAMAHAFDEQGAQNSAVIVIDGPDTNAKTRQQLHSVLALKLAAAKPDVLSVSDPLADARTRSAAVSKDGRVSLLTVRLRGDPGSPATAESVATVREITAQTLAGSGLRGYVSGPPGSVADTFVTTTNALAKITAATGVLIAVILLVVYRSVVTALIPLVSLGLGIGTARGLVSGLGTLGMPVSANAEALMTVVVIAVGIDYSVFLISRFHERVREGASPEDGIVSASAAIGPVILASAATVIAASVAIAFAKLRPLASMGPMLAVGVATGCVCALTLTPAVLTVAARRGYGLPKPERAQAYWERVGRAVVARPFRMLGTALALLGVLAGMSALMNPGYDDRAALPSTAESNRGFALVARNFAPNVLYPQFLLIQSDKDVRTPEGLADLEQLAGRVAQLPGVSAVRGITRPDGHKLTEATIAWQMGQLGNKVADSSAAVTKYKPQLDNLTAAARLIQDEFAGTPLPDFDRLVATMPAMLSASDQAIALLDRYKPLIQQMAKSKALLDQADFAMAHMDEWAHTAQQVSHTLRPIIDGLEHFPWCAVTPDCAKLLPQLKQLQTLSDGEVFAELVALRDAMQQATGGQPISQSIQEMTSLFDQMSTIVGGTDLASITAAAGKFVDLYPQLKAMGLTDFPEMSRMVNELTGTSSGMFDALGQMADYLQKLSREAASPAASGFFMDNTILQNPDFKTAAKMFISPDGRTVRYLVESTEDPYSAESRALVDRIDETAASALPNTSLQGATVGLAGFPAVVTDLQHYFSRDLRTVVIATLLVVFLILALLLRAVVAPIYLLITVGLTYLSALGAGVLVFQVILGDHLFWWVPMITFILLVAVGADYNLLLMARLREETGESYREGVVRTVASTGSVITSAGMIFAASMFGLIAGGLGFMTQMGFVIGFGILLDTFVVRTLVVPAIAMVLGRYSWWPSTVHRRAQAHRR